MLLSIHGSLPIVAPASDDADVLASLMFSTVEWTPLSHSHHAEQAIEISAIIANHGKEKVSIIRAPQRQEVSKATGLL